MKQGLGTAVFMKTTEYDMFDSIFVKWYHQGKKKRNCGEFPH